MALDHSLTHSILINLFIKPDLIVSPNPPLLSMVLVLGTSWCRFSRFKRDTRKTNFLSDNMEFIHMAANAARRLVFGSTRGVVKLKFVKLSSSSCNKWTWKDKKHSARQNPYVNLY